MSQSCVNTILNKLPNLTAFNFDGIVLPANEIKVSLHEMYKCSAFMCVQ